MLYLLKWVALPDKLHLFCHQLGDGHLSHSFIIDSKRMRIEHSRQWARGTGTRAWTAVEPLRAVSGVLA